MITFSGSLVEAKSGKPLVGASVTITVTKPDTTVDSIVVITQNDGTFNSSNDYPNAGEYSAQASYTGDNVYNPAASVAVPFQVGKQDVTLTLNVAVS